MERRKLLQVLVALPAMGMIDGKTLKPAGSVYEINPKKKYIIFLNPMTVDIDKFCENEANAKLFGGGTPIIPVLDGDMDNAVRIYEVDNGSLRPEPK
jgi:hypothetical protein